MYIQFNYFPTSKLAAFKCKYQKYQLKLYNIKIIKCSLNLLKKRKYIDLQKEYKACPSPSLPLPARSPFLMPMARPMPYSFRPGGEIAQDNPFKL